MLSDMGAEKQLQKKTINQMNMNWYEQKIK